MPARVDSYVVVADEVLPQMPSQTPFILLFCSRPRPFQDIKFDDIFESYLVPALAATTAMKSKYWLTPRLTNSKHKDVE